MRLFALFAVAAFTALLMMMGLWALLGIRGAPLAGGVGAAARDVLVYAALTGACFYVLSRRLRR